MEHSDWLSNKLAQARSYIHEKSQYFCLRLHIAPNPKQHQQRGLHLFTHPRSTYSSLHLNSLIITASQAPSYSKIATEEELLAAKKALLDAFTEVNAKEIIEAIADGDITILFDFDGTCANPGEKINIDFKTTLDQLQTSLCRGSGIVTGRCVADIDKDTRGSRYNVYGALGTESRVITPCCYSSLTCKTASTEVSDSLTHGEDLKADVWSLFSRI